MIGNGRVAYRRLLFLVFGLFKANRPDVKVGYQDDGTERVRGDLATRTPRDAGIEPRPTRAVITPRQQERIPVAAAPQ